MSIPSAELRRCARTVLPQVLTVLAACSPTKPPSYPTSTAMAPAARPAYVADAPAAEGFRTSDQDIAAFRFGAVAESYAAQTSGDQNVGVIGLAFFAERGARWTPAEVQRREAADPFPNRGYAVAPR